MRTDWAASESAISSSRLEILLTRSPSPGCSLKVVTVGPAILADNAGATAKLKQGGLQRLGSLFQLLVRRRGGRRLWVGMQDFERRELETVLLVALGIDSGTVRSPIGGCNRSSGSRGGGGIGNLGML